MHEQVRAFVAGSVGVGPFWPRVVEFGARDVNGTVRDLIPHQTWVGIDLTAGPGVDRVMDCRDYYPLTPPDLIVCCEVLEHCAGAGEIVAHAGEILRPGGWFVMTCATDGRAPHGCDGGPVGDEFYKNVSSAEFLAWVLPWGRVRALEVDTSAGDLRAVVEKKDGA